MELNDNWIYRELHTFNILINIKDNKILTLSPILASLFNSSKETVEARVLELLDNYKEIKQDDINKVLIQMKGLGVIL